jgi:outer membrane protein OmpA-like peptidoglycan-associated protein
MFSSDDDNQGLVLGVIFGVIALVVALVIGLGIYTRNQTATRAPAAVAAPAAAHGEAAHGAAPAADAASIKVENGVVKFYFASGKADVAAGAKDALAEVVKAVAAGKKAVVSGFHDASGDAAKNAELSKLRAFAVRDALKALGVAEDKIELKKPEETLAHGPAEQARRVEVSVQ